MNYLIKTNKKYPEIEAIASDVAHNGLPADSDVFFAYRNTVAWFPSVHGRINVKSFKKPGAFNSFIYGFFRPSKAKRSFEFAFGLKERGFKTPEPLAYMECKERGRLRNSYYLSDQIDADEIRHVCGYPECDKILTAFGKEIARLHKAGVWMHDFSPGNSMFVKNPDNPDGYDFYYVDLNRISFDVFSPKKLMRMFKTLVPDNKHLRVITDAYAEAMNLDADEVFKAAVEENLKYERFQKRKRFVKSLLGV